MIYYLYGMFNTTNQTKMKSDLIEQIEVKHEDRLIGYANKYKVRISYQKRSGVFEYTDSVANTNEGKEPEIKDVLYCLVMDYTSASETFQDFCDEFGYDNDSIKSLNVFKACQKNSEKMKRIFGPVLNALHKEYEGY